MQMNISNQICIFHYETVQGFLKDPVLQQLHGDSNPSPLDQDNDLLFLSGTNSF